MDLSNKLFHGINLGNYGCWIGNLKDTDVLKSILEYGMVFTRQHLCGTPFNNYLNPLYGQNRNEVCLATHPNNSKLDMGKAYYTEDAFFDFVRYNIALIFDEKLLLDKVYNIRGIYREVRVVDSININENLVAIGYFDRVENVISELETIILNEDIDGFKKIRRISYIHNLLQTDDVEQWADDLKIEYFFIRYYLEIYNIEVPVLDSYTGLPITQDIDLQIERAKEVKSKIKTLIRNNL